jgi:hypothetical protein
MSRVLDAAGRLAEELEGAGFDYALSGAIALAYWATPRATVDIDLAVDADATRLPELVAALANAGCSIDESQALDLERLLATQRDRLDYDYMDGWVRSMFPADDPRVARFRALCDRARA